MGGWVAVDVGVQMSRERLWVGESMVTSRSWRSPPVGLPCDGAGRLWRANSLLMKALNSLPLCTCQNK